MHRLVFLIVICLLGTESLAKSVDVDCQPAKAWDTGYQVQLTQAEDETFDGVLNELTIYRQIPKYHGPVNLALMVDSTACVVKISTVAENGDQFELQMTQEGNAVLVSVADKPVNAGVRAMNCHRSDQFILAQQTICGN